MDKEKCNSKENVLPAVIQVNQSYTISVHDSWQEGKKTPLLMFLNGECTKCDARCFAVIKGGDGNYHGISKGVLANQYGYDVDQQESGAKSVAFGSF